MWMCGKNSIFPVYVACFQDFFINFDLLSCIFGATASWDSNHSCFQPLCTTGYYRSENCLPYHGVKGSCLLTPINATANVISPTFDLQVEQCRVLQHVLYYVPW